MSIFRPRPDRDADNGRFGESALPRPDFQSSEPPAARPEFVLEPKRDDPVRSTPATAPAAAPAAPSTPASASPLNDLRLERESRLSATDPDKCTNIIASTSKWSGTLTVEDSVRIDGQVSGEVVAKGTVHISEGARVEAKVRAAFVVIRGSFKGEARCSEKLELMPKSRVEGSFYTKLLNVHEGALVDGNIQMQSERVAAKGPEAAPEPERAPTTRSRTATSA